MTISLFFQLLINGLALGLLYMLVVLGLDVIVRVTGLVNFAHGQIYMLGAYTIFFAQSIAHTPFAVGLLLAGIAMGLLGGICYVLVFYPMHRRFKVGQSFIYQMVMSAMASLGLMMILSQSALIYFGAAQKNVASPFNKMVNIASVRIPVEKLAVIALSLVILALLYLIFFRTKLGLAMRAVSLDAEVGSMHGINSFLVFVIGFAIGCGLAGFAGAIIAPVFSVSIDMGGSMIFTAVMVMLIGGMGSYKGTIVASVLVGLVMSFGQFWIGGLSQVFLFCFVIALLLVRPGGLFGDQTE